MAAQPVVPPRAGHEYDANTIENRDQNLLEAFADPLPRWVNQHVKVWTCQQPVPDKKKLNHCCCGRPLGVHSRPLDPRVREWRIETCGVASASRNFGEILFEDPPEPALPKDDDDDSSSSGSESDTDSVASMPLLAPERVEEKHGAPFIRLSHKTSPKDIKTLLTEYWSLDPPRILISVTGGAKSFDLPPRLDEMIKVGLSRAASSSTAWIVTGGTNAGVMKYTAKACLSSSGQKKGVVIGIAPWSVVNNKQVFDNAGCNSMVYYGDPNVYGDKNNKSLDENHSHFILVDDGTVDKFEGEIALRAAIEDEIAKMFSRGDFDIEAPVMHVLIVIQGGKGTIKTCEAAALKGTPMIVVAGSGMAADAIAYAWNMMHSPGPENDMGLRRLLAAMLEAVESDKRVVELEARVRNIVKQKHLVRVFRVDVFGNQERPLDDVIFDFMLELDDYQRYTQVAHWTFNCNPAERKRRQELDRARKLELALMWNRMDVAQKLTSEFRVISHEALRNLSSLTLGKISMLRHALRNNRMEFARLFFETMDMEDVSLMLKMKHSDQIIDNNEFYGENMVDNNVNIEVSSPVHTTVPEGEELPDNTANNNNIKSLNSIRLQPIRGSKKLAGDATPSSSSSASSSSAAAAAAPAATAIAEGPSSAEQSPKIRRSSAPVTASSAATAAAADTMSRKASSASTGSAGEETKRKSSVAAVMPSPNLRRAVQKRKRSAAAVHLLQTVPQPLDVDAFEVPIHISLAMKKDIAVAWSISFIEPDLDEYAMEKQLLGSKAAWVDDAEYFVRFLVSQGFMLSLDKDCEPQNPKKIPDKLYLVLAETYHHKSVHREREATALSLPKQNMVQFSALDEESKNACIARVRKMLKCLLRKRYRIWQPDTFEALFTALDPRKSRHVNRLFKHGRFWRSHIHSVIADLIGKHVYQKHLMDSEPEWNPYYELMVWAVLSNHPDLAVYFWTLDPKNALVNATVALRMCLELPRQKHIHLAPEIEASYEDMATEFRGIVLDLLKSAAHTDSARAAEMLKLESSHAGFCPVWKLAFEIGENEEGKNEIAATEACAAVVNQRWWGALSVDTGYTKVLLGIVFPPYVMFHKKQLKSGAAKSLLHDVFMDIALPQKNLDTTNQKYAHPILHKFKSLLKGKAASRYRAFTKAPVVCYCLECISWILFLLLYSYVAITPTASLSSSNATDSSAYLGAVWISYIWSLALIMDELRQVSVSGFDVWFRGMWNRWDAVIYILITLTFILRFVGDADSLMNAHTIAAVTSFMLWTRSGRLYAIHPVLGPKLVMIKLMITDILVFLALIAIVLLGYGVAVYALLFPFRPFDNQTVKNLFYRPYFQIYGELFLDEMRADSTCLGENFDQCGLTQSYMIVFLLALYILIANVLLVNLLIAMMGNTYDKVDQLSQVIWSHQNVELLFEFDNKWFFPAPLNLPFNLYLFLQYCWHRITTIRISNKILPSDHYPHQLRHQHRHHHFHHIHHDRKHKRKPTGEEAEMFEFISDQAASVIKAREVRLAESQNAVKTSQEIRKLTEMVQNMQVNMEIAKRRKLASILSLNESEA